MLHRNADFSYQIHSTKTGIRKVTVVTNRRPTVITHDGSIDEAQMDNLLSDFFFVSVLLRGRSELVPRFFRTDAQVLVDEFLGVLLKHKQAGA